MVGPLYADGQELILTTQPSPGPPSSAGVWRSRGTRSPITVEMDDDKTVVATFEQDTTPTEGPDQDRHGGVGCRRGHLDDRRPLPHR